MVSCKIFLKANPSIDDSIVCSVEMSGSDVIRW